MFAALKIVAMFAVFAGALAVQVAPARGIGPAADLGYGSQVSPSLCADLKPGWRLSTGESLFSALAGFRLTMQEDGNLVLYVIDDMKLPPDILHVLSGAPDALKLYAKPLWSTGTHVPKEGKSRGSYCVMEEDGNFVVYDKDQHVVFETGTGGHPGSYLRLQSDGNLVVYTPFRKVSWKSDTGARQNLAARFDPPRVMMDRRLVRALPRGLQAQLSMDLRPRWRLDRGDSLYSPLCGFKLILQDDGNLVLYVVDDEKVPDDVAPLLFHAEQTPNLHHDALWSAGTHVPTQAAGTGAYCIMKDDGNFVVYDINGKPCFQSNTKGHPGAFLRCQDDGNLVIYTRDKKAIWQSKTYAPLVEKPVPARR